MCTTNRVWKFCCYSSLLCGICNIYYTNHFSIALFIFRLGHFIFVTFERGVPFLLKFDELLLETGCVVAGRLLKFVEYG